MRFARCIFAFVLSMAGMGYAKAGAWLMPEGHGQIIAGADIALASDRFDDQGVAKKDRTERRADASAFLEFGVAPQLTVIAAPTVDRSNALPAINDVTGTTGSAFGARIGLYASPATVLSVQLLVVPPIGLAAEPTALDLRVLLGRSFAVAGLPTFVSLEPGLRVGGSIGLPQARFDATIGTRVAPRLQIYAQCFTSYAPATAVLPRASYAKGQGSVVVDVVRDWSLQLGVFRTLFGRNAAREIGPMIAVWSRF